MCGRLVNLDTVARVLADYYHLKTETQLAALDEALSKVPAETVGGGHEKDHVADPGKMVGDLISRQAAIDSLGKDPMGGLNYESILGSLPSAQRWIPISEGLPGMTDTYLVQVGVNENGEGMHTEARTADWNAVWQTWYVHTTRCLVGDIIKWMPIPWEGSNRHEG